MLNFEYGRQKLQENKDVNLSLLHSNLWHLPLRNQPVQRPNRLQQNATEKLNFMWRHSQSHHRLNHLRNRDVREPRSVLRQYQESTY